jgi:hypothetical protein
VLSTPKNASPMGFDLVRITWLSAAPASPDWRIFTLMPDCFVNAASTDFETANESWVTSVTVVEGAAVAGPATTPIVMTRNTATMRRRIRRPFQ